MPMNAHLFEFELRPLDQVKPWGTPADPNLHWFGLTDGQFWIQVGEHRLFEYHQASRNHSGAPQYCDYQVARLYEDIISLVPHALVPVPDDLQHYIKLNEERP